MDLPVSQHAVVTYPNIFKSGKGNWKHVSVYSNEISAGQLQVLEVRVVEAKTVPLEYT